MQLIIFGCISDEQTEAVFDKAFCYAYRRDSLLLRLVALLSNSTWSTFECTLWFKV